MHRSREVVLSGNKSAVVATSPLDLRLEQRTRVSLRWVPSQSRRGRSGFTAEHGLLIRQACDAGSPASEFYQMFVIPVCSLPRYQSGRRYAIGHGEAHNLPISTER